MPSSSFTFYQNVPLDATYQHHLYATSASGYQSALSSYTVSTATAQSYHRIGEPIEVNLAFSTLEKCNYVAIQNPNEMRYYGFITGVRYISPTNTEVSYSIDVIGTYLNQNYVTINQSYVERCHSYTDGVGDNTVPEDEEGAFYICNDITKSLLQTSVYKIVVASAYDLNEYHPDTWGEIIGGLYQGVNYYTYDPANYADVNAGLAAANEDNQLDSIVNIFLFPASMWDDSATPGGVTQNVNVPNDTTSTLDGYAPVNKKLYCYPYRYLQVDNDEGENLIFRYEEFQTPSNILFMVQSVIDTQPSIICRAVNYAGENMYSPRCSFEMNNFPICSFVNDAYKSWYAMNANQIKTTQLQNVASVLGAVAGGVTGNLPLLGASLATMGSTALSTNTTPGLNYGRMMVNNMSNALSGASGAIGGLIQQNAKLKDMENLPNSVRGTGSIDLPFVLGEKDFRFKEMVWRRELLEIRDQYFTLYGYAQKKYMTVSRHNRAKATYVRTIGCNVSGNAPSSAIAQVAQIFDNGITFWSSFSNFFDYSNNTPLGG